MFKEVEFRVISGNILSILTRDIVEVKVVKILTNGI